MQQTNSMPRGRDHLTAEEIVELAERLYAPQPIVHVMHGWGGWALTQWKNPETGQEHFAVSPRVWNRMEDIAVMERGPSVHLTGAKVLWEHPALSFLTLEYVTVPPQGISPHSAGQIPDFTVPTKKVILWPDGRVTT